MIDVPFIRPSFRHRKSSRAQQTIVVSRVHAAPVVPRIDAPQFNAEHGCLDRIEAAVVPFDQMLVLFLLAEIAQQLNAFADPGVIGDDGAAVAIGAQILPRIKAEATGVADASGSPPLPHRSVRLTRIFDDAQSMTARRVEDRLHRDDLPVQVHRHQRLRAWRDRRVNCRRIDQVVIGHLDQHRRRTHTRNAQRRGDVRICRHDDFVARADVQRLERDFQRRRSGLDPHAMPRSR